MSEADAQASPPPAGNGRVQLGIGTLIAIAFIVSTCSGRSELQRVQTETTQLTRQVNEINRKLDLLVSKGASAPAAGVETPTPNDAGATSASRP